MKKILAGCLAAAMFCGGMAVAEAPGTNSLREKINAVQTTGMPETDAGFMIPQAVEEVVASETTQAPETARKPGSLMDQINAAKNGEVSVGIIGGADGPTNIYVSVPEETEAAITLPPETVVEAPSVEPEGVQNRKPGSLMGQINAAKNGEVSVGIIGGADGPTNIYVSVPEETEAAITLPPETVVEAPSVEPEGVQNRKPGSLMDQINTAKNVEVVLTPDEAAAIEVIGGADGPTAVFVAEPEIAENTDLEPVPEEEEAPPAFILRDTLGWHSTKDEVEALFAEVEFYTIDDLLVEIEAADVYDVKVSLFEGEMFFYFHNDQLWAMGYYLDFAEGEAERLLASLATKYGAPEIGADVFMGIVNPISDADMQVEEDEYEVIYNWTTVQNTAVLFGVDAYDGMLAYFNMDYVDQMHAFVAENEFFGI